MATATLLGMPFVHPRRTRQGIATNPWAYARKRLESEFPQIRTVELNVSGHFTKHTVSQPTFAGMPAQPRPVAAPLPGTNAVPLMPFGYMRLRRLFRIRPKAAVFPP